jgi:uncharacterized protein (TIGR03437 family)
VSISVRGSCWSSPARIPVDLSRPERRASTGTGALRVTRVIDGKTYQPQVRAGVAESSVSAWVEGIADLTDISLRLDGVDLPATYIGEPDAAGARQVNAMVPVGTEPGEYWLSARSARQESAPVPVQLVDVAQ